MQKEPTTEPTTNATQAPVITLDQLIAKAQEYKSARACATSSSAYTGDNFTLSNSVYSLERKYMHKFKLVIRKLDSDKDKELKCDGASLSQELATKMQECLSANYTPIAKDKASELEIAKIKLELATKSAQELKNKLDDNKTPQDQRKALLQEFNKALDSANTICLEIDQLEPQAQAHKDKQAQELAQKLAPKAKK